MMWDLFSYGEDAPYGSKEQQQTLWSRREWSFTLCPTPQDEIYIRYQSFKTMNEFREALLRRNPNKIDIGVSD